MKSALAFMFLIFSASVFAQSAHHHFDEIYKAGGLDRMADGYVCFDDDPNLDTFFIFGKSETLKQFLIQTGEFSKLPRNAQREINHGFLLARGYDKGVPLSSEEQYMKDGDSWVEPTVMIKHSKLRVRLSIEWATLRYKRSVEILNANGTLQGVPVSRYGRCEEVPATIQQRGNP